MDLLHNLQNIQSNIPEHVEIVAVSKTKPVSMIQELYDAGHRAFGENKVQDLISKYEQLPEDIQWHMIGHLQSNKVKYIAPFIYLIHAVDSLKLLKVINKEAEKNSRVIDCLLQVYIASETAKFGFDVDDLFSLLGSGEISKLENVNIQGLMGMATYTKDINKIKTEFKNLKRIFENIKENNTDLNIHLSILSMGMSSDYSIAIEEGSNMVRIGSLIFGPRNFTNSYGND